MGYLQCEKENQNNNELELHSSYGAAAIMVVDWNRCKKNEMKTIKISNKQ